MKGIVIVTLFLALYVSYASSADPCNQGAAVDPYTFSQLINRINSFGNIFVKLEVLQNFTKNSTSAFNGTQAVILGKCFSGNTIIMSEVYVQYSNYFLGLLTSDVIAILNSMNNELIKLDVLPSVANLTTDLKKNGQQIVTACFNNYFNQQDAADIINATQPLSCVWGPVTARKLVFVIDVSGSMGTTFTDPNTGLTTSRLQYVQKDLSNVIENVLQPYQYFNLEYFSDSYALWKNALQPVNPTNTAAAVAFVNTFSANGGTNTLGALKAAISDPTVEAVYLLSDGQPNAGQNSAIISLAQQWSKGTPGVKKTVNTVCFQVGGTYDPVAANFMYQVAQVSGGIFRSIQ